MKKTGKTIRLVLLFIVAIFTFTAFFACGEVETETPPPHSSVEGLSDKEVQDIRQVCYDKYCAGQSSEYKVEYKVEYIRIFSCLGRYGGNIVTKIRRPTLDWVTPVSVDIIIDGVFIGSCGTVEFNFYLYIPGTSDEKSDIMTLEEAYEKGYVTKDDLIEIAAIEEATWN